MADPGFAWRGAVSEHALLLRDFVNTADISEGTDELADPGGLERWLRERGLIPAGRPVRGGPSDGGPSDGGPSDGGPSDGGLADGGARAELETALALRSALRSALRAHHDRSAGGAAHRPSGLDAAAASLQLRLAEDSGQPVLVPAEGGVRGGLAKLAAAVVASAADHSWERLKICAEDTCQWAFLDSSKNRSRHWCSMQECGNRSKTRAYRARRAAREHAG